MGTGMTEKKIDDKNINSKKNILKCFVFLWSIVVDEKKISKIIVPAILKINNHLNAKCYFLPSFMTDKINESCKYHMLSYCQQRCTVWSFTMQLKVRLHMKLLVRRISPDLFL